MTTAPTRPEPAAVASEASGWVVEVVTHTGPGRVLAEAVLRDGDGPVLAARGSARVDPDGPPSGVRTAAHVAAFRAVRRLAEEGLRSAHEGPEAWRARVRCTDGSPCAE